MEDFNEWLEGLETQTLTDELKESILDYVRAILHDEYLRGYQNACNDAVVIVKGLSK